MSADDLRKILIQPLINLGLLAKLEPGNIVEIDSQGDWFISKSTPVVSGITSLTRKVMAMATDLRMADRRRDLFFDAMERLVNFVIAICNSLRRWSVVEASSEPMGGGFLKLKIQNLSTVDQEQISVIIQILQTVVSACMDARKGLSIMQSAPPYNNDPSYWEKVKQRIDMPMCVFLRNVYCCLGEFQGHMFAGIRSKEDILPRGETVSVSVPSAVASRSPLTTIPKESKTIAVSPLHLAALSHTIQSSVATINHKPIAPTGSTASANPNPSTNVVVAAPATAAAAAATAATPADSIVEDTTDEKHSEILDSVHPPPNGQE